MIKIIFSLLLIQIIIFSFGNANSQIIRYTPPSVTLGAAFDMNFATNDAYGRVLNQVPFSERDDYGMRAGKGFELYAKFGIGTMKRHRITTSVSYNKMINYDRNSSIISQIFSGNPDDVVHTNFTILSGTLGYEYLFGAPCCNKQHLGVAMSFNGIGSVADNLTPIGKINNTFRLGLQFSGGYEFMLGQGGQWGLDIGFKYNWTNLFFQGNAVDQPGASEVNLNDGKNEGGRGYTRWIGMATINVGVNYYTGVKQILKIK